MQSIAVHVGSNRSDKPDRRRIEPALSDDIRYPVAVDLDVVVGKGHQTTYGGAPTDIPRRSRPHPEGPQDSRGGITGRINEPLPDRRVIDDNDLD
jgi:hypothetical protein